MLSTRRTQPPPGNGPLTVSRKLTVGIGPDRDQEMGRMSNPGAPTRKLVGTSGTILTVSKETGSVHPEQTTPSTASRQALTDTS